VRKSEDRLRVTVQLIDALKGHHLWAEQYDREMKDIFAVQDDITMQILKSLQVQLTGGPTGIKAKGTQSLQAYLKFLEAVSVFNKFTRDGNALAQQLFEATIAIDPEYASAYGLLSFVHQLNNVMGISKSRRESLERAIQYAKKAQALDNKNYIGYIAMAGNYLQKRDHENAIKEAQKAINLAPGAAGPYKSLAQALCFSGRSREAIEYYKKAIRNDPFPSPTYYLELGYAYFLTGDYEGTVRVCMKACALIPDNEGCHRTLAAAYGMLGKNMEARFEVSELLRIMPEWSIEGWKQRQGGEYKNQADVDHFVEGWRRAGLPEKPPLLLPDKPSIAVLPFVNMSDDPRQEYFSDGITEEIIAALSRLSDLFVIARNSSFTYKGKAVWVPEVAKELGVRYVLEGSVRRSGDKVRITAQLIDGKTNHHVWSETYDRQLKDIFAIQDEVTIKVLTAVKVEVVGDAERVLAAASRTSNLRAYLKILEGMAHGNANRFTESTEALEEAMSLDPNCVAIYEYLAWAKFMDVWFGPSATRGQSLQSAFEYAQKCLALDESNPGCHSVLGHAYLLKRDYQKALSEGKRSIELNPNSPESATMYGWTLRSVGRYEEAIQEYKRAMRLDPMQIIFPLSQLGATYLMMGRPEEAIATNRQVLALRKEGGLAVWIVQAMAYSSLDRMEEARAAVSEVLKRSPNFSLEHFAKTLPYKSEAVRQAMVDALRKAGMK
jgi:TolB-like protein/Tfp pilus assembly protein PilF